jgi:hypothetical protein
MRSLVLTLLVASCARPGGPNLFPGNDDAGVVISNPDANVEPPPPPIDAGPLISACSQGVGCFEYHPPTHVDCRGEVLDACPRPAQAICDFNWYWIYYYYRLIEIPQTDGGYVAKVIEGAAPEADTCDAPDAGPGAVMPNILWPEDGGS